MGALSVPLLSLSLKRCGSAPIQLNIEEDDYDRFAAAVSPTVALQRKEYGTLWIDLEWDNVALVSQLTSESVSHLRVLSIIVNSVNRDPATSTHLLFSRALALRELSLSPDTPTILDSFRFPNLTTLSLICAAPINQTKVLEFLRISPGLKRVALAFQHLTTDEKPSPPVLLQSLRQLRICAATSGDSHLQLVTKLTCPVAEDVSISVHPAYAGFGSFTALVPFPSSWGFFPHSSQVHAMELHVKKSRAETIYSVRLLYGEASRFEISFNFVPYRGGGMFPIGFDPRELSVLQAAVRSLRVLSPNGVARLSIMALTPPSLPLQLCQGFSPRSGNSWRTRKTWGVSSFRMVT